MELRRLLKRIFGKTHLQRYRVYQGVYLPLTRSNEGLSNDKDFITSAVEQVYDLQQYYKLNSNIKILDFGCGQGRFAIGLLVMGFDIDSYCGIDTNTESVKWCKRWIQRYHPKFTFIHVPAYNARYNLSAMSRPTLPVKANSYNVAFLNSVFSHMLTDDLQFYLNQLYHALCLGGILYATAFVEVNVPKVEENPQGYLGKKSMGALHRVRYERSYFLGLIEKAGFAIVDFQHQKIERTKQSVLVARKDA